MSLRPDDKQEDELIREKVLEHAKAMGCTCEPDISYTKPGDALKLLVAHDDDCAVMQP